MTLKNKPSRLTTIALLLLIAGAVVLNLVWLSSRRFYKDVPSLAGKNRGELVSVLKHYSGKHGDSLKLEAAKFLITNMVYHHGMTQNLSDQVGEKVDFDYSSFPPGDFKRLIRVMDSLRYRYVRGIPVYDIQIIKADYLIENIDDAFTAWNYPWARHLSFHDFCEHILPYRSQTEPLSSYRKYFMEQFSWLPDSLPESYELIDIVDIIKRHLEKRVVYSEEIPLFYSGYLDPFELEQVKVAACENLALYFQLALRSLGVPARCDKVLAWRHRSSQHLYNSVSDIDGTEYFFGLHGKFRGVIDRHLNRTRTWRLTFALSTPPEELAGAKGLHPQFINPYYQDVTSLYAPVRRLEFLLDKRYSGEFIYLCVFNFGDWRPVAYTTASNEGKVIFPSVTPETIYRLCSYHSDEIVNLTLPFRFDSLGNTMMLIPDFGDPQSIIIEKAPDQHWIKRNTSGNESWFTLQYLSEGVWEPVRSDSFRAFSYGADSVKVWYNDGHIPSDIPIRYEISFNGLPGNALFYWGGFSKPFSIDNNEIVF
jgi:hypothetical protein